MWKILGRDKLSKDSEVWKHGSKNSDGGKDVCGAMLSACCVERMCVERCSQLLFAAVWCIRLYWHSRKLFFACIQKFSFRQWHTTLLQKPLYQVKLVPISLWASGVRLTCAVTFCVWQVVHLPPDPAFTCFDFIAAGVLHCSKLSFGSWTWGVKELAVSWCA